MGKCTLAPFSPTPPPAAPPSPSQCGAAQGSSRTCPASSQVLLGSPPSLIPVITEGFSLHHLPYLSASRVTPKPSLRQQSERSLKPSLKDGIP